VFAGLPGGPELGEEPLELTDELLDALLSGASTAEEIAGPDGLLGQLTRRLLSRALEAELTEHLGYQPGEAPPGGAGNARNGRPGKTILTDQGAAADPLPAGPQGHVRAADREEAPDAVGRIRRSCDQPLRPRADGPRDPGAPGRDLRD
jgi:hypothetical protein